MPEEYLNATVIEQHRWNDRLRSLRLAVPGKLSFEAGQFTKLGLPGEEARPLARAYSFVNSPDEEPYDFLYDILEEEGNLTPLLGQLAAGDSILVSARPNGLLTLSNIPEADSVFFIATGTGVGPFLSILKTPAPWERFERVVLGYSVRYKQDQAYQDLIQDLAEKHSDRFRYIPMVTREEVPGTQSCRVTEALQNGSLERLAEAAIGERSQFMLCGSPDMVAEMSALLQEKGLERNRVKRPGNVTIEKYW